MNEKSFRQIDDDERRADLSNCNKWVLKHPKEACPAVFNGLDQGSGNKGILWGKLLYNGCQ